MEAAKILWEYHRLIIPIQKVDFIFGFGSYDEATALHCAALYQQAVAPLILFSGKEGNWTRGKWNCTEAEHFKNIAIEKGVPREAILLEKEAENCGDNIRFTRKLFRELQLDPERAVLVSKPQTSRRLVATMEIEWPDLIIGTSCIDRTFEDPLPPGHSTEAFINELVGDLDRIIEYPKKGLQSPQEIPTIVNESYTFLKSKGYDKHCI